MRPLPRPLRLLAYVWAAPGTLVGLLVAATTGARPRVRDGVLCFSGRRGFCALHARMGFAAITLGHVVVHSLRRDQPDGPPGERLWAHEMVHVRQWEILGPLMLVLYPLGSLAGYRRNPFEAWARRVSGA